MDGKVAIEKLTTLKNRTILVNGEYTALEMAIKALEKQIPLKVKYDEEGYQCICPSCGVDDISDDFFCWKCGQRLGWS